MRRPRPRSKPEPTIALINVVFLMLIFFLVAGTLAPPMDPDLNLVDTRDLEGKEPSDALVVTAEGALRYRGQPIEDAGPYLTTLADGAPARIIPDRALPAQELLRVSRSLRVGGAETVLIVTEKALQ